MNRHYHLGLLHFTQLLIGADGEINAIEIEALLKIKVMESIPEGTFQEFEQMTKSLTEREAYSKGLDHLTHCNDDEKLRVFATLYRLSEVDGRVHAKEIRLLLYSLKTAGIEFNEVVDFAKQHPFSF
jgi:uncharacterized tellurite resistance protein B-like protein